MCRVLALSVLSLSLAAVSIQAESPSAVLASERQDRSLTLLDSIHAALESNLALQGELAETRAAGALSEQARSRLLPQVDMTLEGRRIDAPRARASLGRQPEYRTSAILRLDQVIYSEEQRALLEIERLLQEARLARQEEKVLDVILEAGGAFLELLRSESLARIRAEEVDLNRTNLERAEARLDLGSANRAEVFRWETALARSRSAAARADARVAAARLQLNRVMNAPLSQTYRTVDPTLEDPYFLIAHEAVLEALERPAERPRLRAFLLDEAVRHAPMLARLREEIAARRRELQSARRSFTRPDVTASAILDQEISRHGQGTEELDIDFSTLFPDRAPGQDTRIGGRTDDLEWMVALRARLPLYQGGMRRARVDEARGRLDALLLRHDELLQRLEVEVRSRSHEAEASFDGIAYAAAAARSGGANLALVREAYEQGVLTIIDLLDAQTAALTAELEAANAVFDFLQDYLALQRSTGRYDITSTAAERDAARARLAAFEDSGR